MQWGSGPLAWLPLSRPAPARGHGGWCTRGHGAWCTRGHGGCCTRGHGGWCTRGPSHTEAETYHGAGHPGHRTLRGAQGSSAICCMTDPEVHQGGPGPVSPSLRGYGRGRALGDRGAATPSTTALGVGSGLGLGGQGVQPASPLQGAHLQHGLPQHMHIRAPSMPGQCQAPCHTSGKGSI